MFKSRNWGATHAVSPLSQPLGHRREDQDTASVRRVGEPPQEELLDGAAMRADTPHRLRNERHAEEGRGHAPANIARRADGADTRSFQ